MTNAWFLGASHSVPQNESEVRSTIDPVRTDGELAEQTTAPDWNEQEHDESGQLTGLSQRVKGSATIDPVKSAPVDIELATANHNRLIDDQVATSGTAAAREAAGQRGHGTMQYEYGIDPLNPAERFGNTFFQRAPLGANEGSGEYMTPPDGDNWAQAVAQSMATRRAREAAQSSLYAAWEG